jgi:hypothetical protein
MVCLVMNCACCCTTVYVRTVFAREGCANANLHEVDLFQEVTARLHFKCDNFIRFDTLRKAKMSTDAVGSDGKLGAIEAQ